jgi:hypothetical protein
MEDAAMSSRFPFRSAMPGRAMLAAAALALFAVACDLHASEASLPGYPAHVAAATEQEDCHALSDLTAKEACFAEHGEELVAQCEAVRVNACKPYADMHRADHRLRELGARMLALNMRRFAAYVGSDPGYLDDLSALALASDEAWRAWRDAACALEPFADGMSRREASDLTEACRATRTEQRSSEIASLIQELEQRKE